jgi:hypothetical protein
MSSPLGGTPLPPPTGKDNYLAEMWSGSEEGSYLRLRDFCITQSRLESNKEEEEKTKLPPPAGSASEPKSVVVAFRIPGGNRQILFLPPGI